MGDLGSLFFYPRSKCRVIQPFTLNHHLRLAWPAVPTLGRVFHVLILSFHSLTDSNCGGVEVVVALYASSEAPCELIHRRPAKMTFFRGQVPGNLFNSFTESRKF